MKINEVVKKTGLTKRTIYFYIEEQLISPGINPENGYFIFSDEDVTRLLLLQQLRKADFSLKDIHALLNHPSSAHIYIQKQLEKLKQEEALLQQKQYCLRQIAEQLPMQVTETTFISAVQHSTFPTVDHVISADPESDARLVSLYLWGPFLQDIEMTEYRQYLWNKLLTKTADSKDPTLYQLKEYLYSLPANKIDAAFAARNLHIKSITNLTPEAIPSFIENMKLHIAELAQNSSFIYYGKQHYKKHIEVATNLYDSELNALATELSPCFSIYCQNIHLCCQEIYDWLYSAPGSQTREKLFKELAGYINLETNHHGEIAVFFNM